MIQVENWIAECEDGNAKVRPIGAIRGLAIHRIDFGPNADDIAKILKKTPGVMGMAYTFVVTDRGKIQQARPLTAQTPHSRGYNRTTLGIAAVGDFRTREPSKEQWDAAVNLCAFLSIYILDLDRGDIKGHTERPGASSDPGKECPGRRWDMGAFRIHLEQRIKTVAAAEMMMKGIVV